MRFSIFAGLIVILALQGSVPAQEKSQLFTPPRLGVTLDAYGNQPSAVKIKAVAKDSLGMSLGLKPGDVLKSLDVGNAKKVIATPMDLSAALAEIRNATLKNKTSTTPITLTVHRKGGETEPIKGVITRSMFPDKTDGSTVYYFRDDNRVPSKAKGK